MDKIVIKSQFLRRRCTMHEKQLINKLKEFQQIKPNKDWVVLVKNQIFIAQSPVKGQIKAQKKQTFGFLDFLPALIHQRKLAYAFASLLFIMVGMFGFAQYTMPGDALFSVKKLTEQSQTAFISQENQLKNNFETANRRLDDLTQVVKDNKMQNIAPAIREFQASISEATKNLVGISGMEQKDYKSIKDIAFQIKKIKDNKKELQTLGVDLEDTKESKDLNDALAPLVLREIDDLENTTLTEDQQKIMQEVKDLYADGKYSDALEGILTIND
ncbi:MAG: hypothetical protein HY005_01430 [Candidatus Staskawiczbacteria bacterium]|nr:hypothetical protein [Candidatus Staskawiczbacteria bacterium]MBI3337269.1 hypothetical protein [Candidatus Staskawiczbacteria bacterium]